MSRRRPAGKSTAKRRNTVREAKKRRERIERWIEKVRGTANGGLTTDQIMAMTRGH